MKVDGSFSGRRHAAYNLLKPQQFRESIALALQPSLRNSSLAGLQAAATIAIALPLVSLSSWSHLIGFASLGSLVALFGRFAPEAKREWIVFLCAICQTLAVFFMSLATWVGLPLPGQLLLLALLRAYSLSPPLPENSDRPARSYSSSQPVPPWRRSGRFSMSSSAPLQRQSSQRSLA